MFRGVILPAFLCAGVLLSTDRQAAGQTTKTWNTTSPNWHTASGWTLPGVPGTSDTALFDINTTDTVTWNAITGNRTAGRLDVFAGNYTFNNITTTPFELSLTSPAFSPLRVLGTTTILNVNGLHINATASNVLIDNAATVNVRVGSGPGIFSMGRITSSSFLRNNGTLNISLGSTVSNTSGSIASAPFSGGTTTVSGVGSTWNNSLSLRVGEGGFGTLNVLGGGVVTTGTSAPNDVVNVLGVSRGSTGAANVSGAGSMWINMGNNQGNLEVGRSGTGILNIENGGVVSNFHGFIGVDPTSSSTAIVTGSGSEWNNSSILGVGIFGSGALNVENGGRANANKGVIAGEGGSTGTVVVMGAGSILDLVIELTVGRGGIGTMTVENGGVVSNVDGAIGDAALGAFGDGEVTVTGPGSMWDNSGFLDVAAFGNGTLMVENGGVVSSGSTISLAVFDGSLGIATIKDIGSTLTGSLMLVGQRGSGLLFVENGGAVSIDGALLVGNGPTSTGTISASGVNSHIDASLLMVGNEGNGFIEIGNGATLTCNQTTLGAANQFSALLQVGDDALFQNSGDVRVGDEGVGLLRVNQAGMALIGGELTIESGSEVVSHGHLQVAGGITNNDSLLLVSEANIASDVVNNADILTVENSDVLIDGDLLHIGAAIRTDGNSRTRIAGAAGGNGPYTGSGLVQFDGRFEPGVLGPGQISFEGSVQLATNAPLQVQLAGPGTNSFDRMLIEGALTIELQRTLEVSLINGFAIAPGQQFEIVEVGTTRTGQFAGLSGGSLVGNFGGTELFISYAGGDGNDIVLYTIGLLGDINGDGVVSLLDVAPFVNVLSSGVFVPEADINRDGVISLLDVSPFVALLTG